MQVYIQWDEEKRRRNLREHGIDFVGLAGYFDGEVLTREDARYEYFEPRFQSISLFKGAILFVVWTPADAEGATVRLISARKATRHEAQAWLSYYSAGH